MSPQIKGRTSRQLSNDDSMMTYLTVPGTPERRGSLDGCGDSKSLQDPDLGDSSRFSRRCAARSTWSAGSRNRAMVQVYTYKDLVERESLFFHPNTMRYQRISSI